MSPPGSGEIIGGEKNITTDNLARLKMLLSGVKDPESDLDQVD